MESEDRDVCRGEKVVLKVVMENECSELYGDGKLEILEKWWRLKVVMENK